MRIRGHVVRSLQLVFAEDWLYASGQDHSRFDIARLWPADMPLRADGPINAQVLVSGPTRAGKPSTACTWRRSRKHTSACGW
jgi:cardiolipin synthase